MDCGGQFERDSTVMSQVPLDGVDLCDNLHRPETLAAQTRNLNETNTLAQTSNPCASQNEEKREHRIILNTSFNNNGKDEEEQEVDKEGYTGKGTEDEEDEDTDEVMKEADEEEEESEESSALIHCLSPDTPMTDSSYSETGSLLDSPYPFSPGTSPEPTSPVVPVNPLGLSQSDTDVDSHISITHPSTVGDSPVDSTTLTLSSDPRPSSPPGLTCISGTADSTAQTSSFTAEHVTSSSQPILCHRPTCTRASDTSHAEPRASSRLSTAVASTTGPPSFTSTDPMPTTGPITSNWEHITSMSGPILSASPLECLEQLAHKGDDTHLPQYLHQIAETFVLHEDSDQRALWCVQLERLYHQRILDNLNTLQEQWERKCSGSSSLDIQHLDSLKHICLTHSRPVAGDAVCAPWDTVRPTFEEGGAKRACILARHVDGGIEQRAEDSSRSQSGHSIIPSINVSDKFRSSEISKKHEEDPSRELRARDRSQLTDMEHSNSETGRAEKDVGHTITVIGNGLHPPTAGGMDQSKPAEQQGGDLGLTREREAKVEEEETDVEVAVGGLEMKDEGEEEEKDRDAESAQKDPPTVSGGETGAQQWHQDSGKTRLTQEEQFSQEANVKQQEEGEEEEEEEDEVYEEEQTDIIREAASLDDMAKLITVEEMSPASGLVSILKKRSACVDNLSTTVTSEPQPEKPTAKRRVRFKVPDDGYEQDVGGGDSCLLLFLLCLVTVVISVGGTALYCALGDVQSSVCQDFSRNADFYFGQIQRGITQIHHWFAPGS